MFLSWAIYSTRPIKIEELMELYAPELHTIIDLKHRISEICGQFVVVDTNNHVVLVHQTAREYLRTCAGLPFSLDAFEVNEELFLQCLRVLCDLSLRTKIRQRKNPMFLSYASVSWAVHLNHSSVESDRVLETLVKFFSGIFPLPWIQFLAMDGRLSHLVAVSSHLMSFVRKRRKLDAIKPPSLLRLPELSLLETWALDLLKITAKFGTHLIDYPDAIYKYVPALSPASSILYQKYGKKLSATISVSDVSNTDWDDCLARVSNGPDPVLHIAVSAEYLAIANDSPNGRIQLWSNVVFPERSASNPVTGRLSANIQSPYRERPKVMQFGQDELYLIVATDLRRVYRLDLNNTCPTWLSFGPSLLEESSLPKGAFINSPSSAGFNPDCTQIAVAYRGFPLSIWNLDPPELIARCRRKEKQGQTRNTTWTGVNRVVWHPSNSQVLGLYCDGDIFKWGPTDDNYEEVKQELDATPSEIQCSPNGLVFATSDIRGSIKIYDYAQMVQMYRLNSDDIIKAITFSPDSRRLYNLRGSYCNVWEPNCLIRLVNTSIGPTEDNESVTSSEQKGKGSSVSDIGDKGGFTISLPESEAHANTNPPITVVTTCARNHNIFAHATDDGAIKICDIESKCKYSITQFTFGVDVEHLALSQDGEYVAYCLVNGRITVKSIDFSSLPEQISTRTVFGETNSITRGRIRQVLFDRKSERLLVCDIERLQVLRVKDGSVIAERTLDPTERPAQWGNHPKDPDLLLAFRLAELA
ncbi:hypothetical protein PHISCL_08271 [Aspergillus sclerotialis]|uniref:GPI inositol-deacylase winged helix domain-containing protein n=1 Tax=Aspergillus sclerotialis TaxID=2070753 RepID=A0A3A2ZJ64_9EURO|nr:hypothetical protein PHISCL_08271 [Aspergillus sclerotialis]